MQKNKWMKKSGVLFLIFCSACSPLLNQKTKTELSPHFKNEISASSQSTLREYWKILNDPQLNDLLQKALQNNASLQASLYRLERDFSLAKLKLAELFPQDNLQSSFQRQSLSENTGQPVGTFIPKTLNLWELGLGVQYELDLWGRLRNQVYAAQAQAKAEAYLFDDFKKNLVSQLVINYLSLQFYEEKFKNDEIIFKKYEQNYKKYSDLKNSGFINAEQVLRAGALALNAKDQLSADEAQLNSLKMSVAILAGENPTNFTLDSHLHSVFLEKNFPSSSLLLPEQIPSEWIKNRRDIQAAEQNIIASQKLTRSALAEFFPQITFSAKLGFSANHLSDLFKQSSQFLALGPQLSLPIFSLPSKSIQYQARKKEILASFEDYRQKLLEAIGDVETQLKNFSTQEEAYQNSFLLLKNSSQVLKLNQSKFKAGLLSKIDEEKIEIENRQVYTEHLSRRLQFLTQWIKVLRALGT